MLIGINSKNEIKQIDNITDQSLNQIDVDRKLAFGSWSDTRILCSCYVAHEKYTEVYPYIDEDKITELESEILNLQAQVIELEFEKIGGTSV